MNIDSLFDNECAICGKTRKQHHTGSGVGMCQIYPIFRSKRDMARSLISAIEGETKREAVLRQIAHDGQLCADEYGCGTCNVHAELARAALETKGSSV